jgi:hypothetical protein
MYRFWESGADLYRFIKALSKSAPANDTAWEVLKSYSEHAELRQKYAAEVHRADI